MCGIARGRDNWAARSKLNSRFNYTRERARLPDTHLLALDITAANWAQFRMSASIILAVEQCSRPLHFAHYLCGQTDNA